MAYHDDKRSTNRIMTEADRAATFAALLESARSFREIAANPDCQQLAAQFVAQAEHAERLAAEFESADGIKLIFD